MSFSIRHIFVFVVYMSVGLAALLNPNQQLSRLIVQLLSLSTFVWCAYEIWASQGEARVFRIGFVLWGGIYYLLFVIIQTWRVDLGSSAIVNGLIWWLAPDRYSWDSHQQMMMVAHPLFALFYGVIGGWVTVYYYRKRQRMLGQHASPAGRGRESSSG